MLVNHGKSASDIIQRATGLLMTIHELTAKAKREGLTSDEQQVKARAHDELDAIQALDPSPWDAVAWLQAGGKL